jgi:hypothetical protein
MNENIFLIVKLTNVHNVQLKHLLFSLGQCFLVSHFENALMPFLVKMYATVCSIFATIFSTILLKTIVKKTMLKDLLFLFVRQKMQLTKRITAFSLMTFEFCFFLHL